jgi:hypothetical protein
MKIGVYRGLHPLRANSFMAVWTALHKSDWVYIELYYTSSWIIEEREDFANLLSLLPTHFKKHLIINLNCDDDNADALKELQGLIISMPNIYVCTHVIKLFKLMQTTLDPNIRIGYKMAHPQDTHRISSRISFLLVYIQQFSFENIRALRKAFPGISVYSYVCYNTSDLYSLHRYGPLLDIIFCTGTL